ncbi:MAG TPA: hypothetical protein VIN59_06795 [Alphaproteobacteria bacterium]
MSPAMTNAAITLTSEVENVLGTFADLLDRESDVVQVCDFEGFKSLQNDKFALLSRYRALMETLKYQGPQLKGAGEAITNRLNAATIRLQESAKRNTTTLERASGSMQRITDRIVRAARETIYADRQTYNGNGRSALNPAIPVSMQINEVL